MKFMIALFIIRKTENNLYNRKNGWVNHRTFLIEYYEIIKNIAICEVFITQCEGNKAVYKTVFVLKLEQISNYS